VPTPATDQLQLTTRKGATKSTGQSARRNESYGTLYQRPCGEASAGQSEGQVGRVRTLAGGFGPVKLAGGPNSVKERQPRKKNSGPAQKRSGILEL